MFSKQEIVILCLSTCPGSLRYSAKHLRLVLETGQFPGGNSEQCFLGCVISADTFHQVLQLLLHRCCRPAHHLSGVSFKNTSFTRMFVKLRRKFLVSDLFGRNAKSDSLQGRKSCALRGVGGDRMQQKETLLLAPKWSAVGFTLQCNINSGVSYYNFLATEKQAYFV